MPEFSDLDNYVLTLTQNTITKIDTSDRSGVAAVLKSDAANTATVYVGRSTNKAEAALSATTGFPLAAGESVSLDIVLKVNGADGSYPAAFSAGVSQKLCILKLFP